MSFPRDMLARRVGIEIEVESEAVSIHDVSRRTSEELHEFWRLDTNEGSLRAGEYGWEIKTPEPGLPAAKALPSLNMLYPLLKHSTGTWRAAVHCHVDVSNMDQMQRAIMLGVSYCVDEFIFAMHSPARVESNFCVPLLSKSPDVLDALHQMVTDSPTVRTYGKYSSVNIAPMSTLGTFEYRHMQTPRMDGDVESIEAGIEAIKKFVLDVLSIPHSVLRLVPNRDGRGEDNPFRTQSYLMAALKYFDSRMQSRHRLSGSCYNKEALSHALLTIMRQPGRRVITTGSRAEMDELLARGRSVMQEMNTRISRLMSQQTELMVDHEVDDIEELDEAAYDEYLHLDSAASRLQVAMTVVANAIRNLRHALESDTPQVSEQERRNAELNEALRNLRESEPRWFPEIEIDRPLDQVMPSFRGQTDTTATTARYTVHINTNEDDQRY